MSVPEYRKMVTLAANERKRHISESVKSGIESGSSRKEIAERLGISLASVDNYAKEEYSVHNRQKQNKRLKNALVDKVKEVEYLDVSAGVELPNRLIGDCKADYSNKTCFTTLHH